MLSMRMDRWTAAHLQFGTVVPPSVKNRHPAVRTLTGQAVRDAHGWLRDTASLPLGYHGFVEGDQIGQGIVDVVVVEGIAYATLGNSGVAAVDLTEPANPRLLGSVKVPGFAGPIDVARGHAFVGWHGASGSLGGVAVVDMTDPGAPALVDTYGRFPSLNHLEVAADHLFVSDESEGLVVFRITGPA